VRKICNKLFQQFLSMKLESVM